MAVKTGAQKALEFVAQVLHDVNPLEHVGDFAAYQAKKSSFEDFISVKSSTVASNVCNLLEKPYQDEVIEPLQDNLDAEQDTLKKLKEQRGKDIADSIKKKTELGKDIRTLRNLF